MEFNKEELELLQTSVLINLDWAWNNSNDIFFSKKERDNFHNEVKVLRELFIKLSK